MSLKISKVKLVSVNGIPVIAPRSFTTDQIKQWYEDDSEIEVDAVLPLRATARPDHNEPTYAELIEQREFEPDDLPVFL